MTECIPDEIAGQVAAARVAIEQHLGATLEAIHLFGS
ncbi:MAG: aminoglycoside resistance protein, partial [Burkholderia sp.]|nr:aminoglycoside resistance protein [Burkholderia sp.]